MNDIPNIAVLMTTHNGLLWLKEQIQSIEHQVSVNVTIFFSDDQSTDGTLEYLEKLQSKFVKLYVLPSRLKFGSAGANFLRMLKDVDFTAFDYVAFSDQDDVWHKEKLSTAVTTIAKKSVDAYSSNVTAFWQNGRKRMIVKSQPLQAYDYMFESAGPGCSFVFTRELAAEIQKFLRLQQRYKEIDLHDWFVYAFARSNGYKWYIDSSSFIDYRQHGTNVVGANIGLVAKLIRFKKVQQGWYVSQVKLLSELLCYQDSWPIVRILRHKFFDRLILITNITKLRRRWRDRIALALLFLLPMKS